MKLWPRMKSGTIADFEAGTLLRAVGFPLGIVVMHGEFKQVVTIDNGRFVTGALRGDIEVCAFLEPLEVQLRLPAPMSRAAPGVDGGTNLFVTGQGPCIVAGALEGPSWRFVNLDSCTTLPGAGNATFVFEHWSLGFKRPDGTVEVLQSF
jgi:hypothetical protein